MKENLDAQTVASTCWGLGPSGLCTLCLMKDFRSNQQKSHSLGHATESQEIINNCYSRRFGDDVVRQQ